MKITSSKGLNAPSSAAPRRAAGSGFALGGAGGASKDALDVLQIGVRNGR